MPENKSFSDNPIFAFLLEKEHLSSEEVRELTRRSRADCMPLGQVLVRHKIITIQQLMQVLAIQDERPRSRIGELCVEYGFCGSSDLDAALALQGRSAPHALTVLLNDRGAENAELVTAIGHYVERLERRESSLEKTASELQNRVFELQSQLDQRLSA